MTSDPTPNRIPLQVPEEEYARRMAALERMEVIRERAIADGLELWDWDRFEAEMRERFGDDED